jgi:short-subunit dehydrogenase
MIPPMNGKRWILISGASTGIGRATAEYLSQNGFHIYACARKRADLESLGQIPNVVPISLDVTNDQEIKTAFDRISDKETGLYGLINNAGIALAGPTMELDVDTFKQQFDVNLFGVHRMTRTFFPLIQESLGKIIMIGSGAGIIAKPFFAPYSSSKFALEGYTDALRRELMALGIKVVIIDPGMVKTPIWKKGEHLIENFPGGILKKEGQTFGRYALSTLQDIGLDPMRIAELILKILTIKNPKPRYSIAKDSFKRLLMKKMPTKLLDKLMMKLMKKE